jgi:hypothetical protein
VFVNDENIDNNNNNTTTTHVSSESSSSSSETPHSIAHASPIVARLVNNGGRGGGINAPIVLLLRERERERERDRERERERERESADQREVHCWQQHSPHDARS